MPIGLTLRSHKDAQKANPTEAPLVDIETLLWDGKIQPTAHKPLMIMDLFCIPAGPPVLFTEQQEFQYPPKRTD